MRLLVTPDSTVKNSERTAAGQKALELEALGDQFSWTKVTPLSPGPKQEFKYPMKSFTKVHKQAGALRRPPQLGANRRQGLM